MDGVFMKKIMKSIIVVLSILLFGQMLFTVLADKQQLQKNLIRLHVIANSDSKIDQDSKLLVRDAIVDYLQPKLEAISDKEH